MNATILCSLMRNPRRWLRYDYLSTIILNKDPIYQFYIFSTKWEQQSYCTKKYWHNKNSKFDFSDSKMEQIWTKRLRNDYIQRKIDVKQERDLHLEEETNRFMQNLNIRPTENDESFPKIVQDFRDDYMSSIYQPGMDLCYTIAGLTYHGLEFSDPNTLFEATEDFMLYLKNERYTDARHMRMLSLLYLSYPIIRPTITDKFLNDIYSSADYIHSSATESLEFENIFDRFQIYCKNLTLIPRLSDFPWAFVTELVTFSWACLDCSSDFEDNKNSIFAPVGNYIFEKHQDVVEYIIAHAEPSRRMGINL